MCRAAFFRRCTQVYLELFSVGGGADTPVQHLQDTPGTFFVWSRRSGWPVVVRVRPKLARNECAIRREGARTTDTLEASRPTELAFSEPALCAHLRAPITFSLSLRCLKSCHFPSIPLSKSFQISFLAYAFLLGWSVFNLLHK